MGDGGWSFMTHTLNWYGRMLISHGQIEEEETRSLKSASKFKIFPYS